MTALTKIPPEIRAEAAAWLARLRSDDKSASDERAFQAWLAADPLHAAAFEVVTEVWEEVGAAWPAPMRPVVQPPAVTRRRALLATAGSVVAAGAFFMLWQRAVAGVYETEVGEQKHIVLADGTQVFLDTDTRIRACYDSEMRVVDLERGRCNFHVMANDERPFVVDVATKRIVAEKTIFDVRRDGDMVCVVLLQGAASIGEKKATALHREILKPGQRLVATREGARVDKPNLVPLVAWQTGQAVFDDESLSEAVNEMNRYSVVKLQVNDPSVGGMRISGVYRVGDNVAFARSIATLLPVAVQFKADQVQLVADRARFKKG